MYTHTINKIVGNRAFVTLHKQTDETEIYTEQVTVSDAVFATEETPFIPPVFGIVEHTRPKVIHTDVVVTFTNQSEIPAKVQEQIDLIENPPQPEPTPEPVPPTAEELARDAWLAQFQLLERSLRAKEKLEAVGLSFDEEEQARFDALVDWVAKNRKIEYVEYM